MYVEHKRYNSSMVCAKKDEIQYMFYVKEKEFQCMVHAKSHYFSVASLYVGSEISYRFYQAFKYHIRADMR